MGCGIILSREAHACGQRLESGDKTCAIHTCIRERTTWYGYVEARANILLAPDMIVYAVFDCQMVLALWQRQIKETDQFIVA